MHRFDEVQLRERLEQLPVTHRIAIAAAAATRQMGNLGRAPESGATVRAQFLAALEAVWGAVATGRGPSDWPDVRATLMGYMTDDARDNFPEWTVWHTLSDDALASLVYAIRTLETGSTQDAAWAVGRAYEAADQATIRLLGGVQRGLPETERMLLAHPGVQRELGRQAEDLADAGHPGALRARALVSPLLSAEEISTLGGDTEK